jgi:PleD family two-component response regulator
MSLEEKPLTILLVDDSATARISTVNLIKDQNITVVTAENGIDAFSQIAEVMPSLVLLDLSMPLWDGMVVLSFIRNTPSIAHIPVVILSGKDGLCDKADALNLGANEFLVKPCTKTQLLNVIDRYVSAQ